MMIKCCNQWTLELKHWQLFCEWCIKSTEICSHLCVENRVCFKWSIFNVQAFCHATFRGSHPRCIKSSKSSTFMWIKYRCAKHKFSSCLYIDEMKLIISIWPRVLTRMFESIFILFAEDQTSKAGKHFVYCGFWETLMNISAFPLKT